MAKSLHEYRLERKFQQRLFVVLGESQHAPIELQPRKLAIYVVLGRLEVHRATWPGHGSGVNAAASEAGFARLRRGGCPRAAGAEWLV